MYLNLDRVEFTMAYHCTGRCAHCSQGEMSDHPPGHLPYALCEGALTRLAQRVPLRSAMCFGGEPLLWPGDTVALLREAKTAGIPRRQVITNGYFSRDPARVAQVAGWLGEVGAEVLLSADAFHQRRIPLPAVLDFACSPVAGIGIRLPNTGRARKKSWVSPLGLGRAPGPARPPRRPGR